MEQTRENIISSEEGEIGKRNISERNDVLNDQNFSQEQRIQWERMSGDHFLLDLIGAKLVEFRPGYARAEVDIRQEHLNGLGIVQGGVLFSLGDYACAAACNYQIDPAVSIETTISNIHAGKCQKIIAEAKEIDRSRSFSLCQSEIKDESGTLLARLTCRLFIMKKK